MRRFGLTIDSLRSAEVVTADGEILRASADQHADLFWALRGGGGNFGIVTEFEFALHELSELLILAMFHPLADARRVIELGRREMGDPMARDELLWTSFLRRASDVPGCRRPSSVRTASCRSSSGPAMPPTAGPCWPGSARSCGRR